MSTDSIDVFSFMALRGCERLDLAASRLRFVRDDAYALPNIGLQNNTHAFGRPLAGSVAPPAGLNDVDLFSPDSPSPIGRNLWADILAGLDLNGIIGRVESQLLLGLEYPGAGGPVRLPPILLEVNVTQVLQPIDAIRLGSLSQRLHYRYGDNIRILPDSIGDIQSGLTGVVARAWSHALARMAGPGKDGKLELARFLDELVLGMELPQGESPLTDWVFDRSRGGYAAGFAHIKRVFFDALYALYVLRKREKVNLEPAIVGLRALHFLELLAIVEFLEVLERSGPNGAFTAASAPLRAVLTGVYPLLRTWKPKNGDFAAQMSAAAVHVPASWSELRDMARATPVVNPVFARFATGFMPFNKITPIGIGDLKVVKQTFLGYRKGEIAHIETVLAGEEKTREHRALEKTEDTISLVSSSENESTRDSQSTKRFELKREAEEIIKNDINANANATVTYNGQMVVASASAGFSFANSRTETQRQSSNLVNEVIDKATSRIVERASETRSRTMLFETEEKNVHSFKNPATNGNISGIYRWLDKIYEGRIHNFGKRMMFEFILPEPAAFYVQSKLYAYAASLDLPDYPQGIKKKQAALPIVAAYEVTDEVYEQLKQPYHLGDLPPPPETVSVPITKADGTRDFTVSSNLTRRVGHDVFSVKRTTEPSDYIVDSLVVIGKIDFYVASFSAPGTTNTFGVTYNGVQVLNHVDESRKFWVWTGAEPESFAPWIGTQPPQDFVITLDSEDCSFFQVQLALRYRRSAAAYKAWQDAVFERIKTFPVPETDEPIDGRITAYEETLKKIEPRQINDIITGSSPDANARMVRSELKRQCISVIAKEYDSQTGDDVVSRVEAVGQIVVGAQPQPAAGIDFPTLSIVRGREGMPTTVARYVDKADGPHTFAAIKLNDAERKGRFVQFLEQAFEWEHLSQVYFPYFWAAMPKWVALMSREDIGDPQFTEFLRAGSARVLLAVRPGYENAVLHFLATREPWEGGPAPVIGDALYVPLYEEIREEQDSFAGSVPDGEPWRFALPTSLIYLESDNYPLVNEYLEPEP